MQFQAPQANYAKDVSVAMPNASQGVDNNGIVLGHWKSDILGCCDAIVPNGLTAFFCPGISLAQISARVGFFKFSTIAVTYVALLLLVSIAAIVGKSEFLNWVSALACMAFALLVARFRWRIRYLFAIPGSAVEDCCLSCFCGCCTIAQMATHVESYNPGTCTFAPKSTLEGYTFS